MREPQPRAIHLKDYSPPEFRIDSLDLDVDLRDDHARVRAKLQVRRNGGPGPLVLDGEELQLISVSLDGKQPQYEDRKSTRLNSSHRCISYAVFCLKKK